MADQKLLEYFIERTDRRFDEIEAKVDELLAFKWQIIGGSILASALMTVLVNLLIFFVEHKGG